jgi:hypothetical protein
MLLGGTGRLSGQDYRMGWQAVHAGGGVLSGGAFELAGSVGQIESGDVITGGNYDWQGGFWTAWAGLGPVVEEAPPLVIRLNGDQVILSWDEGTGAYILQESEDLESPVWVSSRVENGVPTSPLAGRTMYYRLVGD